MRILAVTFGHSNDTFHHHINHFFKKVIPTLSRRFFQSPDPNQVHPKTQDNSRYYPFFKNFLGAIDGTHIPISISPDKYSPFRNRNDTLSINVMMVYDFDLNITFISSGWEGSATDSRVLRSTMSKGFQVPPGIYCVGHLSEGTYNFTSIPSQREEEILHQIDDVEDGAQAEEEVLQKIHEVRDEDDEEKDARDKEEARSEKRRMTAQERN